MAEIAGGLPHYEACLCCGSPYVFMGDNCPCRSIPDWYQNEHGEVACALHRFEKLYSHRRPKRTIILPARVARNAGNLVRELLRNGRH